MSKPTASDQTKASKELPRCGAITRKGAPCRNLAISEGRCWVHGARKGKTVSDEKAADTVPDRSETLGQFHPEAPQTKDLGITNTADLETERSQSPVAPETNQADSELEVTSDHDSNPDDTLPLIELGEKALEISDHDSWGKKPAPDHVRPVSEADAPDSGLDKDLPTPAELEDRGFTGPPENGDAEPEGASNSIRPIKETERGIEFDKDRPEPETQRDQAPQAPEPEEEIIEMDAQELELEIVPDEETGPDAEALELEPPPLELDTDANRMPEQPAGEADQISALDIEDLGLKIVSDEETGPDGEAPELEPPPLELDTDANRMPEQTGDEADQISAPDIEDLGLKMVSDEEIGPDGETPELEPSTLELDSDANRVPEQTGDGADQISAPAIEDLELEIIPAEEVGPGDGAPEPEFPTLEPDTDANRMPERPQSTPQKSSGSTGRISAVEEAQDYRRVGLDRTPETDPFKKAGQYYSAAGKAVSRFKAKSDKTLLESERKKFYASVSALKKPEPFWRKRISMPVPVFLSVITIAALVLATYISTVNFGTPVPIVSSLLGLRTRDPGNTHIAILGLESRFVQNSMEGTLLVISGQARNDYPDARRFISLTARLYTRNNFFKAHNVFLGNLISDEDLAELPLEAILKRLANRSGERGINERVAPRGTRPFMVVFSQLPSDLEALDHYTVEAKHSLPAN